MKREALPYLETRPAASCISRLPAIAGSENPGGKTRCEVIRKLKSGEFRLSSKKIAPKTGKRRNLGTFSTREAAEKHEREVQYFKRH